MDEDLRDLPFDWAFLNCGHAIAMIEEALVGGDHQSVVREYCKGSRGQPLKTERGIMLQVKRAGFDTLGDVLANHYSEIPVSLAQRGDFVVVPVNENGEPDKNGGEATGYVIDGRVRARTIGGSRLIFLEHATRAFAV